MDTCWKTIVNLHDFLVLKYDQNVEVVSCKKHKTFTGVYLFPLYFQEAMSGCVGSEACKCSQYVQVPNTFDCYTCGHVGRDHKGLGRVAVEGDIWNESSCYIVFSRGVFQGFWSLSSLSFQFSIQFLTISNDCYKKGYLKSIRLHGKSRNCRIFQFLFPC